MYGVASLELMRGAHQRWRLSIEYTKVSRILQ